jgi:hypothetical protein
LLSNQISLDQAESPCAASFDQAHARRRSCGVPLAGFAASFRIAGAARARRCLVAVRIRRLTGGMGRSTRFFLITYISGFSGVASDACGQASCPDKSMPGIFVPAFFYLPVPMWAGNRRNRATGCALSRYWI